MSGAVRARRSAPRRPRGRAWDGWRGARVQVYLPKEELEALRRAAAGSGRSVAELVREAIRKVVLKPQAAGPVAICDGEPRQTSTAHDSVHNEP